MCAAKEKRCLDRSSSCESINSVYLSCSSVAVREDHRHSASSQYQSFSPCSDDVSLIGKGNLGPKLVLAMGDVVLRSEEVEPQVASPMPKCYQLDTTGAALGLITGGPGDAVVTIHRHLPPSDATEGVLRQAIYMFKSAVNWKYAARVLMADLSRDGVYFVGICWLLKRPYLLANGAPFEEKEPYILHCVCKEPKKRFGGRIGPISTYVPHQEPTSGKRIGGIWVSLFADQIYAEFVGQVTPFQAEYRRRLKDIDEQFDQVMFFASNDAACVGIQVLNTKREEKLIKQSKRVYHHERPLILQDGFYLVEGKFSTGLLNCHSAVHRQLALDLAASPKIVLLGEGIHLIRTQTEAMQAVSARKQNRRDKVAARLSPGSGSFPASSASSSAAKSGPTSAPSTRSPSNVNLPLADCAPTDDPDSGRVNKIRKVEICLDCRYERLLALDYRSLKQDFAFKLDSEEQ